MKKAKKITAKAAKRESVNVLILLDRSQSMSRKWDETLGAINGYVKELGKDKTGDAAVTLATFDHIGELKFEVIRDGKSPDDWADVTNKDAQPRGYTPLYDAIGRIVTMADNAADKRTVIVVMTDGEENKSSELKKDDAAKLLAKCREKGWQVVFLGADFDAFSQASSVGVDRGQTITTSSGSYGATMSMMAAKTSAYRGAGGQSVRMSFSDDDRDLAAGKKK